MQRIIYYVKDVARLPEDKVGEKLIDSIDRTRRARPRNKWKSLVELVEFGRVWKSLSSQKTPKEKMGWRRKRRI